MNPSLLKQLIRRLGFLPGLGPRSARRLALYLLENRKRTLAPLVDLLEKASATIHPCSVCGYMDTNNPCVLCQDTKRNPRILCIVGHMTDVWAIERSHHFQGAYHILGGLLSVLDGIGPSDLRMQSLIERLNNKPVQEIIFALPPNLEGTATTQLLTKEIAGTASHTAQQTILARGLPSGGELDFLDEDTLRAALDHRHKLPAP